MLVRGLDCFTVPTRWLEDYSVGYETWTLNWLHLMQIGDVSSCNAFCVGCNPFQIQAANGNSHHFSEGTDSPSNSPRGVGGGGRTPSLRVSKYVPRFRLPFSASGRSFCPPKFYHVYHFIQILLGPISKAPHLQQVDDLFDPQNWPNLSFHSDLVGSHFELRAAHPY